MAKLLKLKNPLQGHVTDGEHFGRKMENEQEKSGGDWWGQVDTLIEDIE